MKRPRSFVLILIIIVIGSLAWLVLHKPAAAVATASKAIAVTTALAKNDDVPVWLNGIGSVQANNTVTVRPRVSGELDSIQFTEGQEVKAGDILARIDPRPYQATLDQALAQKAQDEARLINDRREFERVRGLVATNTESRQLLDERAATLAQSTALVQAAQATVDNAKLDLDFTTVRAPIAGRTGVRLVDAGNVVTASQSNGIVVLTQTRPITIIFTLPQQNFLAVQHGIKRSDTTPLPVEAVADDGTILAHGKLALIDNQIDASTGTLRLKATFPNEDESLWPGQFINARVLVETLPQALVVPAEAVQPGIDGPFVYVVKADSTVEPRSLKLGATANGITVITGGLSAGERVIREGQNKLSPGSLVVVEKPNLLPSDAVASADSVAASTAPAATPASATPAANAVPAASAK